MWRRAFLLMAAVLLVSAEPQKTDRAVAKRNFWAGITASRPVFVPQEDTTDLVIHFSVVNDADKTHDPAIESSQLLVNGKELEGWSILIMNGPRDEWFEALPPGKHIHFTMALGDRFKKPGIYKLVWKGKSFQTKELEFRVVAGEGKCE